MLRKAKALTEEIEDETSNQFFGSEDLNVNLDCWLRGTLSDNEILQRLIEMKATAQERAERMLTDKEELDAEREDQMGEIIRDFGEIDDPWEAGGGAA